jgi:hypothetical protein
MIDLLEKSKYPIIVLEGPDGVGKSSLAKELSSYLGARYIHLTYRFKDKMHIYHYAAIRLAAHLSQNQPVVMDRWWPSEIVYADVYRGGSPFIKHYFLLEHVAAKLGVTYVMCLPKDREQYLDHFERLRGTRTKAENERDPDGPLGALWDEYDDFYKSYFTLRDNVCHYDMFQNYNDNEVSRGIVMRNVCQNILEFTEDYRSTL